MTRWRLGEDATLKLWGDTVRVECVPEGIPQSTGATWSQQREETKLKAALRYRTRCSPTNSSQFCGVQPDSPAELTRETEGLFLMFVLARTVSTLGELGVQNSCTRSPRTAGATGTLHLHMPVVGGVFLSGVIAHLSDSRQVSLH